MKAQAYTHRWIEDIAVTLRINWRTSFFLFIFKWLPKKADDNIENSDSRTRRLHYCVDETCKRQAMMNLSIKLKLSS